MGKSAAREETLYNMLKAAGRISIADATESFEISEATARRLFASLEKKGVAVRDYGGIQLNTSGDPYRFEHHERENVSEKQLIGKAAADLVQSNDTIYLDCGTTLLQMVQALGRRIALGEIDSINIVTNSIANLMMLPSDPTCKIILTGGEYDHKRRDFSGCITERDIEPFHFNKCFLGCDAISLQGGFMSNRITLSSLNSKIVERSNQAFVLADSSKFDHNAFATYAAIDQLHCVITESLPSDKLTTAIQRLGSQIIVAGQKK